MKALQEAKKQVAEATQRRKGSCSKIIIEALEKLRETSKKGIEELALHERALTLQLAELDKVIELLCLHKDAYAPSPSNWSR